MFAKHVASLKCEVIRSTRILSAWDIMIKRLSHIEVETYLTEMLSKYQQVERKESYI